MNGVRKNKARFLHFERMLWGYLSLVFLALAVYYSTKSPVQTSNSLASHTLLLVMVKNEALVMERMLTSFKQGANYLFLCDTGSNDTTISIAERVWKRNYKVHRTSFVNFEVTRNECNMYARLYIQKLRSLGVQLDFVMLADADYVFSPRQGGENAFPSYDVNTIQIYGQPHNALHMLIKYETFTKCKYRLWTHEFLDCGTAATMGYYNGFHFVDHADGASRKEKLTRDISLLKEWLEKVNATDLRPRALYYLARAQEDHGDWQDALQTYALHNQEQNFTNYLFYSKYRIALISMQQVFAKQNSTTLLDIASADALVESLFLHAFNEHDAYFRAEPLYWLARYFRERGMLNKCILYATAALNLPAIDFSRMPLFLEMYVYDWAVEEELAFCLQLKGRAEESKQHYTTILQKNVGRLDEETLKRIKAKL